ncbi:hypothetical protein [Maritimibacter dapengensis]|uniref:Lipoprotein n=1 Tax=Maritimibacter dapengensis TaxID=2836868 RepID=A0ABS6SWE4_9RHOB|nr:hypothetical protein [Maritimibacter dapengensis]MBV7377290.1 hypothetical protein [Maritimibacter dapengensis]
MTKTIIGMAVIGTFLVSCAKAPENIAAADIGTNAYRGYSCSQLTQTKVKYRQALANLSAQQQDAAAGDAFGVFLLGLPLASMSGSDKETQIAVTKGHLQAIELEEARKGC